MSDKTNAWRDEVLILLSSRKIDIADIKDDPKQALRALVKMVVEEVANEVEINLRLRK